MLFSPCVYRYVIMIVFISVMVLQILDFLPEKFLFNSSDQNSNGDGGHQLIPLVP